jgi:hypothetical protein
MEAWEIKTMGKGAATSGIVVKSAILNEQLVTNTALPSPGRNQRLHLRLKTSEGDLNCHDP